MKQVKVNDITYFYLDVKPINVTAYPDSTSLNFSRNSALYTLIIPGTPPFQRYQLLRLLFAENLETLVDGKPLKLQRIDNDIVLYTYDLSNHQDSVFIYKQ